MTNLENDPIRPLLDRKKDSAVIETDPQYGYDRVFPADDILDQMGSLYADQIVQGDKNWAERFERMRAAEDCYEAEKKGTDAVLTIPLAKGIINQQVAWITNQILGKTPFVSWHPLDGGVYEVPTAVMNGAPTPVPGYDGVAPQPAYETEELDGETVAKNFEDLLQYYLTECEDFDQLVDDTVHAIDSGENPTYWRVDYDPRVLHAKTRKFIRGGAGVQIFGVEDTEIVPRNIVRLRHVSGYNVTTSLPSSDLQTAWWVAEKRPKTTSELWEGIKSGQYDFAKKGKRGKNNGKNNDALIRKVLAFGERLRENDPIEASAERIDGIVDEMPRDEHDVRTVSLFHPLRITPPGGKAAIEIRSLIGDLHVKSRTFLNLMVNWSFSGQRLIIPFYRNKRPHRSSGMSAAGDILPIQNLLSDIFHLQIQNKVQNNVKVYLYRENTPVDRWMKAHDYVVRPGSAIPYSETDDVSSQQLGSPIETTAPEIALLMSLGDNLLVRDETSVPNRTPGSTVSQVQETAKQQSIRLLRSIRKPIAKAAMLYVQTVAQFSAYAVIPFADPEKKRIVSKIIGFPREIIANHFACHVTATGDDDSPQARFEKAGLLAQDTDAQNESDMKLLVTILNGHEPQAKRDAAKFLLLRRNRLFGERIRAARLDVQHFVIDDKLLTEWEDSLKQEAASAPPAEPPPPQIKVSLSGQLTPEQEAAAAMQVGIGGQDAQLPPAQGGGSVPGAAPGQGAPGGMPGEPVLQGVPQPGVPGPPQPPGPPVQ